MEVLALNCAPPGYEHLGQAVGVTAFQSAVVSYPQCVCEGVHSLQLPMSKEIHLGERVCRSHQLKMSWIGPGCSPSGNSRQRDIIQVQEGL